ncbi:hypothetical protein TIFTF001_022016 [Ficus carica]|uniref:Uncharacterized protein n=1 Tax=Ficus carica TaxID=3494 RepID=A0AA88AGZ9_FICCA|nr:hypothetical protein TIFTF001_022016 [Ficus carica]
MEGGGQPKVTEAASLIVRGLTSVGGAHAGDLGRGKGRGVGPSRIATGGLRSRGTGFSSHGEGCPWEYRGSRSSGATGDLGCRDGVVHHRCGWGEGKDSCSTGSKELLSHLEQKTKNINGRAGDLP